MQKLEQWTSSMLTICQENVQFITCIQGQSEPAHYAQWMVCGLEIFLFLVVCPIANCIVLAMY